MQQQCSAKEEEKLPNKKNGRKYGKAWKKVNVKTVVETEYGETGVNQPQEGKGARREAGAAKLS